LNPFKFLFHLVTLGMFRKYRGAKIQTGARRAMVQFQLPRWDRPSEAEIVGLLSLWFNEEEVHHLTHTRWNFGSPIAWVENTQSGQRLVEHLSRLFRQDIKAYVRACDPVTWIARVSDYYDLEHLGWCKNCKEITQVRWDYNEEEDDGTDTQVCANCGSSDDFTSFEDMSPKEVDKHVKQAA